MAEHLADFRRIAIRTITNWVRNKLVQSFYDLYYLPKEPKQDNKIEQNLTTYYTF